MLASQLMRRRSEERSPSQTTKEHRSQSSRSRILASNRAVPLGSSATVRPTKEDYGWV
jgi:hypothetical protein